MLKYDACNLIFTKSVNIFVDNKSYILRVLLFCINYSYGRNQSGNTVNKV